MLGAIIILFSDAGAWEKVSGIEIPKIIEITKLIMKIFLNLLNITL